MFKRFFVRLLIVLQFYSNLVASVSYAIDLDDFFKNCNEVYLHSFIKQDGELNLAFGNEKTKDFKILNIPTFQTLKGLLKEKKSLKSEDSDEESSTNDENSFECDGITRTSLFSHFSLQGLDFSINNNGVIKVSGSQNDSDNSSKSILLGSNQGVVFESVEADFFRVRSNKIINSGKSLISRLMLEGTKSEESIFINDGTLTTSDLLLKNLKVGNYESVLAQSLGIEGKVEFEGSIETDDVILEENASLKLENGSFKTLLLNKNSSLEVEKEIYVDVLKSIDGSIKNANSISINEIKGKSSFKEIHNSHFLSINKSHNVSIKTLINSGAFGVNEGSLNVDSFKNQGAFKVQTLEVNNDLLVEGSLEIDNLTSKASVEVKEGATLTSKVQTQIKGELLIDEDGKAELCNLKSDHFTSITNYGSLNLNDQRKASLSLNNHGKATINGKNGLTDQNGAISVLLNNHESGHLRFNKGTFDISSSNGSNTCSFNAGTFVSDSNKTIFLKGFKNTGLWTSSNSRHLIDYSGQDMGNYQINGELEVESLVDCVTALDGLLKTKASKITINSNFVNNQTNRFNRNNLTKILISPLKLNIKGDFNNSFNVHAPSLEIICSNLKTSGELFATMGTLNITASNYAEINSRIGGNGGVEINANNLKILGKEVVPNSNFHPMCLKGDGWSYSFRAPKSDGYKRNGNGIYSNGLIKLICNILESNYGIIQGSNFEIKATRLTNLAGLIAGTRNGLKNIIDASNIINTRDNEGFGCIGHFKSHASGNYHCININYSLEHCPFPYDCKQLHCETSDEGVIFTSGELSLIYYYLKMLASRISSGSDLTLISNNTQFLFTNMRGMRFMPGRTEMQARNNQNCHIISRGNMSAQFATGNITSSFNAENIFIEAARLTLQNLGIKESSVARLVNLTNSMQKELPFDDETSPPTTIVALGKSKSSANLIYKNSLKVLKETMGNTYYTLYRGIQGLGLNPKELFKMMFDETANYVRKHKDTTSRNCMIEYDGLKHPVEVLNNETLTAFDMMRSGVLSVFFEFANTIEYLEKGNSTHNELQKTMMVLPFEVNNSIKAKGDINISSTKDLNIKTSMSSKNVKLTSEGSINIESTTKRHNTLNGYYDTLLRTVVKAEEDLSINAHNNVFLDASTLEAGRRGEITASTVLCKAKPLTSYSEVTTTSKREITTTKTTGIKQEVSVIKAGERFNINARSGVLQQGAKNINVRINAPVIIQEAVKDEHHVETNTIRKKRGGVTGFVSSCFGGNSKKEIQHKSSSWTSKGSENNGDSFIANALKSFKAIGSRFTARTEISAGSEISIQVSNNAYQSQTQSKSSGLVWNKVKSRAETHLTNNNPVFENITYLYAPNVILEKVRGSKDTFTKIKTTAPVIIKEVENKHSVKEQSSKSLTKGASILTKLAVGITMMYGAPMSSFIGLSGVSAVTTNAGFASLCSDSATSLLENNGDPGKAIKALANKQTVKNCAKSMLSAGVIHEITNVIGVNATAKELTDHAQKAVIKAAVDTVLSVSIDGQSLEDALKQGLTSALISTGSSYLASQIGLAKPEIGELNHKLLHGLLGGVSGGLTSTFLGRSFEDGAVSGALGAVVSEVMGEALSPNLTHEEFTDQFMEKAQRSAKWGEFSGALAAFILGYDTEIASQTALNAVENNFLQRFLVYQAAAIAFEANEILKTYEREGLEAALKHLGISALQGVAVGATVKVANNMYKTFTSLKRAYDFVVSKNPILKKALEKFEGKLEKHVETEIAKTKPELNKEQPWNIQKGQEWKEKIVGKAQNTKTEGHAVRSYREAINAAKRDDVEKVFLNRGIRKATDHPIEKPNTRPDVTIRRTDGKIEQIEVPSRTDDIRRLQERMKETNKRLPEYMQSGEQLIREIK